MQLIAFLLVPLAAAACFLLAAALASGARDDTYRSGYRTGMRAASLALPRSAGGLTGEDNEQREKGEPT